MIKVYEVGEVYFNRKTPVPSYDEYKELATKCSQLSKISEQLKEANDIIKSFYLKDRGQAYLDKWGVK